MLRRSVGAFRAPKSRLLISRWEFCAADVATSSMDSHIKIWDVQKGALQKTIEAFPVETWGLAWSIDGNTVLRTPHCPFAFAKEVTLAKFLASTSKSGNVNIWNAESGTREQVLEPGQKFCMSVAFVCHLLSRCMLIDSSEPKRSVPCLWKHRWHCHGV